MNLRNDTFSWIHFNDMIIYFSNMQSLPVTEIRKDSQYEYFAIFL